MSGFRTEAFTGLDFVNILFEKAAEEVDNTVVEVFRDGMKVNTYLCDDTDTSLTIQPLAAGGYTYTVTQVSGGAVHRADGAFTVGQPPENRKTHVPFAFLYERPSNMFWILPGELYRNNKVEIEWMLKNGDLFESVFVGIYNSMSSRMSVTVVKPSDRHFTYTGPLSDSSLIYLEFLMKNGGHACFKCDRGNYNPVTGVCKSSSESST